MNALNFKIGTFWINYGLGKWLARNMQSAHGVSKLSVYSNYEIYKIKKENLKSVFYVLYSQV